MRRRDSAHINRAGGWASGIGGGGHCRGFWTKVLKRPDACWVWLGYLDKDGAGKFCTRVDGKPVTVRAAVYAWGEIVGEIPAGHALLAVVCWNRRCVNPAHRLPVPHRDLVRWITALGRPVEHGDNRGELSGRTKLRNADVLFMRAQERVYGLVPVLARLFQVKAQVVSNILRRKTWKHIGRGNVANRIPLPKLRELAEQRERVESIDERATSRPGAAA